MKLQSAQITRWRSLQVSSPVANYSPSMSFQGQAKKVLHVNTHIENPPVIPFLALSRSGSQSGSVARPAGNPKSMNDIQQALCRHVVQMLQGKKVDLYGEEDEADLITVFMEKSFFRGWQMLCFIHLDEPIQFVMMPSCRNEYLWYPELVSSICGIRSQCTEGSDELGVFVSVTRAGD